MTNNADNDRTSLEAGRGLLRIVGARLTSVQFILNYLILGFDERGALTTLVWPQILKKNVRVIFGMVQYRNELCSLIECEVTTATITQNETIVIQFNDGAEMLIELNSYRGHGERAILSAPKHYLLVL
jgi:hypothetical protein